MTGRRILQITILGITAFEIILQDLVHEDRRLPFANPQDLRVYHKEMKRGIHRDSSKIQLHSGKDD